MNPTPAMFTDALQYGALGLLGLVLMGGLGMAWLLVKYALRAFGAVNDNMIKLGERLDAGSERALATAERIMTRIDTAERAVQDNVNDTRHAGANGQSSSTAQILEAVQGVETTLGVRVVESERRLTAAMRRAKVTE